VSGHGGGGGERWLVSYADFITLLMVLFVVLYSMGQTDVQRYKALAESLRSAFGGQALLVDPGINEAGAGTGESEPNPVDVEGFPQRTSDALDVAGDLTNLLTESGLSNGISVQNNIEGLMLSLSETLLFQPGDATLIPDAYPVLNQIAEMLNRIENQVRVTAYTDDTPPTDPRYPTNWELSAGRSAAIVRHLIDQGVSPERLAVVGRGEYHPVFPNDTPEHRAFNRRAEIAVVYVVETQDYVIDSNVLMESQPTVAAPEGEVVTP
jgi:chemotaxis protein MotB